MGKLFIITIVPKKTSNAIELTAFRSQVSPQTRPISSKMFRAKTNPSLSVGPYSKPTNETKERILSTLKVA